jgi:NitT/TauT family transport system substrate-binding protein
MRSSLIVLKQLLCVALLVCTLCACDSKQPPLRVALLEWPPYELAFWARENQWFNKENAVLLEYKTPSEVTRAFATDSVDIIAVTNDFALTLLEHHPDTRAFILIDSSNGGDTVLSRTKLKPGDSFKDKQIGLESGPLGAYMLARFMETFEITSADLNIKYVDIPGQLEMWNANSIDLLITYEPIRSKILQQGAEEIFTSKDIPNEIVDVFLIREDKIALQKENLTAFVSGWFKAVDDLKKNKPELFEFVANRLNISKETAVETFKQVYVPNYSENMALLSGQNKDYLVGLNKNEQVLIDKGLIKKPVNKEALVTVRALNLLKSN